MERRPFGFQRRERVVRGETKQNGRFRAAVLRIIASATALVSFALIAYVNFSFNSFGVLIPAILWLCSAYLILRS